jgi:hypothetical protein
MVFKKLRGSFRKSKKESSKTDVEPKKETPVRSRRWNESASESSTASMGTDE